MLLNIDNLRYSVYTASMAETDVLRFAEQHDCCAPPVQPVESQESPASVAGIFKVLGDPTRLGILRLLRDSEEPVCVCHLTERFPLNQPTISHHLRLLRKAGLVSAGKRGTWVYYSLRPGRIEEARASLGGLLPEAIPA